MSILLLSASPSLVSRSARVVHHVVKWITSRGHVVDLLQVRELPVQAGLHAHANDARRLAALAQVSGADAVVIAMPVYKAAYSGVLKRFLASLPQHSLEGKAVLPLAIGGSHPHRLALDKGVRQELAGLGAGQVLPSIFAADAQLSWREGRLCLAPDIEARLATGLEQLIATQMH